MSVYLPKAASVAELNRKLNLLLERQASPLQAEITEASELGLTAESGAAWLHPARIALRNSGNSASEGAPRPFIDRHYGIYLMGYALEKPPIDVDAYNREYQDRLMQGRCAL